MRTSTIGVVLAAVTLACTSNVAAETSRPDSCMKGVDTVRTSLTTEVYCGPASAVVTTRDTGAVSIKPGTCIQGLREPGSFDLYLGKNRGGAGPRPLHLHLSKPTAKANPGLYMEWRFTQWASLSSLKLTLTPTGGSFSGTARVRGNGRTVERTSSIKGTFTCGR